MKITILFLTLFILQTYALPRPQQSPISNYIGAEGSKRVDASVNANSESNENHYYAKQGPIRNPSYYQDMFNIPIAFLQAVSDFLSGTHTNTSVAKPTLISKDPSLSLLKPSSVSAGPIDTSIDASEGTNEESNNHQVYTKQGFIPRIPTFYQDILNIPISTLQAVSQFLTTAYNTNASVTSLSSINAGGNSNVASNEVNKNKLSFLKTSPVSQVPIETPSHSTLIGASEDAAVGTNTGSIDNQLLIKQELLQRNPSYYQDMFNIPIATLQAVSNFLTTAYITNASVTNPSPTKTESQIVSESQATFLKLSPVPQVPAETPSHSTLIGASVDAPVAENDNQLQIKQTILLRNPTFYQDIFRIPISTLQAVSHFLTATYTNASVPKTDSLNTANNAMNTVDQPSSLIQSSPSSAQKSPETPNPSNLLDHAPLLKSVQAVDGSVKIVARNEQVTEKSTNEEVILATKER